MIEFKLTKDEIEVIKDSLISFYSSFDDITEYYLKKKLDKLNQKEYTISPDLMFNETDVNPMDMDISFEIIESNLFTNYSQQIATFTIESQIGRQICFGIKENNTGKYLGFTRISSPVSSIKPRNDFFNSNLRLSTINQHFYNGQTIVPVQPFGYNYLGGKLVSLLCISNEVRESFNKKYGTKICVFETTSLYGNTKSSSMYDGLEPYIKYKGLTESKNTLSPTDEIYNEIRSIVRQKYGVSDWNGMLVNPKPSNPKGRELNKIIQIIKAHLKEFDSEQYSIFSEVMKEKSVTLQQKRYYISTMGYTNVQDYFNNGSELKILNQEKYDFKNLVEFWKQKSFKRWTKLKQENKFQKNLQYYNKENIEKGITFEIIR